jgi:hypothetical protein
MHPGKACAYFLSSAAEKLQGGFDVQRAQKRAAKAKDVKMEKSFRKHCLRMHGLLRNFSAEFREIPASSHVLKSARVFHAQGLRLPWQCLPTRQERSPAAQKCF